MSEHTHTPSIKRLERSSSDRMIAGVAGGLGRYFDLNPAFFRIGFVVLTLLGGAGILVYLAALLVVPDEGKGQSIAAEALAQRRERPLPLVGLGLAAVALAVLLSRASVWPAAGAGWVLVLLAGLGILWTHDARRGDRRSRVLVRALVVMLVMAVAAVVAAVSVAFAWFDVSLGDGLGNREETPATLAAVQPSYEVGVGELRIDLSQVGPITRKTRLQAKVGVGELRIVVPRDVTLAVDAKAKVGDVTVLGDHDDGRNAAVQTSGSARLHIDARVGAGEISVVRAAQ